MNKKGVETTTLSVVIGLLVAFILSIILIALIWKFISPDDRGEEDISYFYFTRLAKDLNEMSFGDIRNINYLTKSGFTLIAFNKDISIIKKSDLGGDLCIKFDLKDVQEPVKCRDKNCLCICKSSLDQTPLYYGRNSELNLECDARESRCVELPLKVDSLNACKQFILYDAQEKFYEIELKKESSSFKIKSTASKTL